MVDEILKIFSEHIIEILCRDFFLIYLFIFIFFLFFYFFCFSGLPLWHMEVSRLEVKLELQLQAYITTMAMPDLSHICDLHHSSRQHWILSPLSKARNQTCYLVITSQVRDC